MNKRITLNQIILASSCLLLTSAQALADRPAMDDRAESFEPEIIDISTEIEAIPVFEEELTPETEPENIVEIEELSSVETEVQQEQISDDAEPVIHVYDHQTETKITGDVIELQPGDTLPVNIVDFPRRGMTMDKVRNELGQPLEISDTVGKPPITIWTYKDRVVYFEYTSVVHVVAAH